MSVNTDTPLLQTDQQKQNSNRRNGYMLWLLGGLALLITILVLVPNIKNEQGCFTWNDAYYCPGDCINQDGGYDDTAFYCPTNVEERVMLLYPFTVNTEALCNDGTEPNLHFSEALPGPNEKKWIFRFEGGANCWNEISCADRLVGGEADFTTAARREVIYQDPYGGILNGDPNGNPLFHDYNRVHTHYCTSDFYLGTSPASDNEIGWNFLGNDLMMGTFQEAIGEFGMEDAEVIIIHGMSAGGLGVAAGSDQVLQYLSEAAPNANVTFVIDSGWFVANFSDFTYMDPDCPTTQNCSMSDQYRLGYDLYAPKLSQACEQAFPGEEWKCLIAEYSFEYLTTADNMLIMENLYDYRQEMFKDPLLIATDEYKEELATYVLDSIKASAPPVAFLTGCYNHDSLNMNWTYTIELDGMTSIQLIKDFSEDLSLRITLEDDPSLGVCNEDGCPPNPTCPLTDPSPTFQETLAAPGPHVD